MANSSNSTPAPKFDVETAIDELYVATNCLMLFTEVTFPNNDKRDGLFRPFLLNDQQYKALFLFAVRRKRPRPPFAKWRGLW